MSSSRGVTLLPEDMLRIMPPDALRQMVLGRDPARALDIDLAEGFPQFMDDQRAAAGEPSVPFTHLVTVAQTVGEEPERAGEMLRRGGYEAAAEEPEKLARELSYARNWAGEWAPEQFRLGVLEELPEEAGELDEDQRRYLATVARRLPEEPEGEAVQDLLYSTARELGVKPKKAFAAIYTVLLGKKSGPKAGPFVAGLPGGFVRERFSGVMRDTEDAGEES
jgi:lysyl-tRNA synthetase class 1